MSFSYSTANDNDVLVKRRLMLASYYASLPPPGSKMFWQAVMATTIPLEVLVRLLRTLISSEEEQKGSDRIIEIIIYRTQAHNEAWACYMLSSLTISACEYAMLVGDLCADLSEHLLRVLVAPEQHFWEENFQHALCFARKNVYRLLMKREGFWRDAHVHSTRVPRTHLARLEYAPFTEDEYAQQLLLAVEQSDLLCLVLLLPERLRAVVLLLFWEGRSEKDAARMLGITERTVRNRRHSAFHLLRAKLKAEVE